MKSIKKQVTASEIIDWLEGLFGDVYEHVTESSIVLDVRILPNTDVVFTIGDEDEEDAGDEPC